jgi:acyl-coenzyme A thioesterase PaaI-like protein
MSESLSSRLLRWSIPWLYPPVGRTGVRVTYISADYLEVRIRLPLNRGTRNIVGTIFGGSLYAAVDPFYMSMLMKQLGRDYAVWDKAASIRFLKPGRSTLYATFKLAPDDVERVRLEVAAQGRAERVYPVVLADADGVPHAEIEKVISIKARHRDGRQPSRSTPANDSVAEPPADRQSSGARVKGAP